MKSNVLIDQVGTAGLWLTILVSPCCFPLAAVIASSLGLSTSFELFGSWTFYVLQVMVLMSLVGLIIAYRIHKSLWPLIIAVPSGLAIFYSYYFVNSDTWTGYVYFGMAGLLVSSLINHFQMKMHQKIILLSTITCPHCGYKSEELMPENACQFFYECKSCKTILKPREGDCCVYCSYGSVICPPLQAGKNCC